MTLMCRKNRDEGEFERLGQACVPQRRLGPAWREPAANGEELPCRTSPVNLTFSLISQNVANNVAMR